MRVNLDISTVPEDYRFHHDIRVRFAETDAMGVMHHASYVPFLEESRVEFLRELGHPYKDIRAAGYDLSVSTPAGLSPTANAQHRQRIPDLPLAGGIRRFVAHP